MTTDPRIEAAALEDATDVVWSRSMGEIGVCCHDRERDDYKDAEEIAKEAITAYLAAADKAATITTREEFDALPKSATILGKAGDAFQWGTDFDDVTQGWYMAGSNTPTPIRALMTFGPFTVIHWGTE